MAEDSEGWTGADIEAVCRFAGINSIKRNYNISDLKKLKITKEDFDSAFQTIKEQKGNSSPKENENSGSEKGKIPSMDELKELMPKKDSEKAEEFKESNKKPKEKGKKTSGKKKSPVSKKNFKKSRM